MLEGVGGRAGVFIFMMGVLYEEESSVVYLYSVLYLLRLCVCVWWVWAE